MPESVRYFLTGLVIGIIVGGYAVTHLDETFNGVRDLYDYTLTRVIDAVHQRPDCPDGYTCSKE